MRWGEDVIKIDRDGFGVAWATAPCGCIVKLLAEPGELDAFVDHVIKKTPCETPRNDDQSIERGR